MLLFSLFHLHIQSAYSPLLYLLLSIYLLGSDDVIHQLATDHSPTTAPPGAVAFCKVHGGGRPRGRGNGAESPDRRRVMARAASSCPYQSAPPRPRCVCVPVPGSARSRWRTSKPQLSRPEEPSSVEECMPHAIAIKVAVRG